MLENTKAAIKAEITKCIVEATICSDPAPVHGGGIKKGVKVVDDNIN